MEIITKRGFASKASECPLLYLREQPEPGKLHFREAEALELFKA
ncbi:MAG: hypothetical protein ABIG20_02000 [archaeon]